MNPRWKERWEDMRRPLAILLALTYAVLLFFSFSWSRCFFDGCPNVDSLAVYQPGGAPILLDRRGEAFADLAPSERDVVPLSAMPSHVAQAFLAVEDKRFYEHRGVDWPRVGGAMLVNLRSGEYAQGFSTISMQLARNLFPERISGREQTTRRKLIEIRVAQEIERRYSKQEILELYLNNIYFGNRARGIEAASRQYFNRPAKELSLEQAALLAALPKAPSHYDPRRYPEKALERRNLVLTLMQEQGRVPRLLAQVALRSPLGVLRAPRQEQVESGLAPYFVEQVRRELEGRFGPALYAQPLRIITTLDSTVQRAAEEELRRQLKRVEDGEMGLFEGPRYSLVSEAPEDGTPYLQGAFVMLDARSGDVLSWVGGRDYSHSQFDRVIQARRQPGSAFKPFVYAAALSQGWALSQPLIDQPLQVRLPNGQIWRPRNFTGRYEGRITMRDALVRSKNVATVRLASAVGLDEVADLALDAGIDEPVSPVPSLALGSVTVSPLELTSAYTAFATLGTAVEPRLILRVEDEDGKILWRSRPERHEVLTPPVAFLVTNVLSEALVRGTGNLVQQTGLKVPAAGKTGTTNEGTDAWFVGYTPEVAASVWIGFDQNRPILEGATGGRLAAPLWGRVMARAYQKRAKPRPWQRPAEVVSRPVDPATGLVLKKECASDGSPRELFVEGLIPASYCPGREDPPRNGFPAQQQQLAERKAQKAEQERLAELTEQERQEERQKAAQIAAARRKSEEEARKQQRTAEPEVEREAVAERKAREAEQEKTRIAAARRKAEEEARKQDAAEEAEREAVAKRKAREAEQERTRIAAARRKAEEETRSRAEKERAEREKAAQRKAREREEEKRTALAEKVREEKEEKARLAEKKKEQERERAKLEERRERIAKAEAAADRREKEIAAREKELGVKAKKDREDDRKDKEEARIAEALEKERRARLDEEEEEAQDRDRRRREAREAERARAAEEDEEEDDEDLEERASSSDADLSGWWEMTNTIHSTNYPSFKGLRLGYRVQLEQDGDRLVGRGQKWSENGRTLPASARTPLTVSGTIDGDRVVLEFKERGAKRTTGGSFSWTLSADRTALRGSFQSTAADTSGSSLARRMP